MKPGTNKPMQPATSYLPAQPRDEDELNHNAQEEAAEAAYAQADGGVIENVRPRRALDDPARMGGTVKEPKAARPGKMRDDPKMKELHGRLLNWYNTERELQSFNRYQQAIDEDFFDGLQWSEEDIQALKERGQAPLVYNHVKPSINWLLGTERRTRTDGKVLPREDSDEESAEVKSKLLKYLSDVNRLPFTRSAVWADCIKAGVGWLEDGISTDPSEELIYSRKESWRNILYDSQSTELDINKDGRYIFRKKDIDLDYAIALCPEYEMELRAEAIDAEQLAADDGADFYLGTRTNGELNGDYGTPTRRATSPMSATTTVDLRRARLRMIECWYKMPERVQMLRGGGRYNGEVFDKNSAEHAQAIQDGECCMVSHVRMQMRVCLMTETGILYEGKSPYKHNRFPFTPMWCYRRARDNAPYGVIRDIRDAQEDYNKRASKALFILSTNRIIMEEGAVEDVEETREEAARPDAVLIVKGKKRFELALDKQLAEEHLMLMDRNKQAILDVGGVTNQNLGADTKDLSGIAVGKLQDQGTVVNTPLFDNRLLALQIQSENQLALAEQFYTARKVIRIVGEKKPVEWLRLNDFNAELGQYVNDITKSKADYVIDEQDFKASTRQAMFEQMMELCSKLPPEVALQLLDMVIDFADVPNKEEIVNRIRKLNGQSDPSRKPTPEEIQAQQAAQEEQAAVKKLEMDTAQAQLNLLQAQVEEILSVIKKNAATTLKEGTAAAYQAIQAGGVVAANPGLAPVADAVMAGAGWKDENGQDPNIPQPAQAAPVDPAMAPAVAEAAAPPQDLPVAPELQQADGAQAGIETPTTADNLPPQ